jgi:hypothetical protein
MARTVTAIFDGEVLRPTEPLDLQPETEYRVTIEEPESADPYADRPLMRFADIRIDSGLGDFAEQHDHYLYGTPKR